MPATAAQIDANRANAQNSTGPRSEAGKQTSSQNACSHNLTGGPALAPGENASRYEAHLALYTSQYNPQSLPEQELVKQIADAAWRLDRAAGMERDLLEKHPNPFLDPQDPMTQQLLRLNRYRNTIQRTYDRASKELQVLIEAAETRRKETFDTLLATARTEVQKISGPISTEGAAEIRRRAVTALQAMPLEPARAVLASRNLPAGTKRTQS